MTQQTPPDLTKPIRVSYSKGLRVQRCQYAFALGHNLRLHRIQPRRPPPLWGNGYHAAAAEVWKARAHEEAGLCEVPWAERQELAQRAASRVLVEQAGPGIDVESLARDCAQAAREVCEWVGPEWEVCWLDGEPVVERHLEREIGTINGRQVILEGVLDLGLVHARQLGRVRVTDHKTTSSWPERAGEALPGEDLQGLDLRDDLQTRVYGALLGGVSERVQIEAAHLVRRADVGRPPAKLQRGRGLSRAQSVTATEAQWRDALEREGLDPDEYQAELARARLVRWQAWAPCDLTPTSIDSACKWALSVAAEIDRIERAGLDLEQITRSPQPGRWFPGRDWGGLHPSSEAESFALSGCPACDYREVCLARERGDKAASDLAEAADFTVRPLR